MKISIRVYIIHMHMYYSIRGLPAKSAAEERKHQKLYQEMIAASRKKGTLQLSALLFNIISLELQLAEQSLKLEQKKQSKDEQIGIAQKRWAEILPKFESL